MYVKSWTSVSGTRTLQASQPSRSLRRRSWNYADPFVAQSRHHMKADVFNWRSGSHPSKLFMDFFVTGVDKTNGSYCCCSCSCCCYFCCCCRYPFEPPQMRFITKIWHPNISSQTGAICLDILKDAWSPALTIKTALLSIQALLSAAEPTDPQDAQVAKMYLHDQTQFLNTARFWTESYAKQTETDNTAALSRLMDMGFPSVRRT